MPVIAPIAIDLTVLLVFALLFALAYTTAHTIQWVGDELAHLLRFLPFGWGKRAGNAVKGWAVRASGFFANLASKADYKVAGLWHGTADLFERIGAGVLDLADALHRSNEWILHKIGVNTIPPKIGQLQRRQRTQDAKTQTIQQQIDGVRTEVAHPEAGRIGAAIVAKTRPLDATVTHIEAVELPGLRARTKAREDELSRDVAGVRADVREAERVADNAWQRVKGVAKVVSWPLSAALVATAVGRLGGGWIFCRNWKKLGRSVCRLPTGLIDDLLGLVLAADVLIDPVEIAKLADEAEDVLLPVIEFVAG